MTASNNNSTTDENDIKQYVFHFHCIFSDNIMHEEFVRFLKQEHNPEPMDFLKQVTRLEQENCFLREEASLGNKRRSILSEKETVALAISIFNTFVIEGAVKQVNLGSSTVSDLTQKFSVQLSDTSKWLLPDAPESVFTEAVKVIKFTLEKDTFARFVRSSRWLQLVNSRGLSYLQSVAVLKQVAKYQYTEADFQDQVITAKDIQFIQEFGSEDMKWKHKGHRKENSINAYANEKVSLLFPNISFYKSAMAYKWSGILNFPYHIAAEGLASRVTLIPDYDPNTKATYQLDYHPYEELVKKYGQKVVGNVVRDCYVIHNTISFPFPFKGARFMTTVFTIIEESEGELVHLIGKPCYHEKRHELASESSHDIKSFFHLLLKKLDDNRTFYQQIQIVNVGGAAQYGAKYIATDRAIQFTKNLNKFLALPSFEIKGAKEDYADKARRRSIQALRERKSS